MFDLLIVFVITFFGIFLNVWFFMVTFENLNTSILAKPKVARRLPKVSILVPAHNEAASIAQTLRSVLRLDYPKKKLEVIVVDNASTDGTAEIAKRFSWAKVFKIARKGKSFALEKAFKESSGEVIGILDADTFVSRSVLKKMVAYFDDPEIGAVTNLIRVDEKKNLMSKFQHIEYAASGMVKKLLSILDALYITPGTLSLVRREAVKKVGFSADTLTEDMDMALSLIKRGYKIFHCLDAEVKTIVPKTFKEWVLQRVRWYRGYMQNMYKHRDLMFDNKHLVLGWFVIPISGLLSVGIGVYTTFYLIGDVLYSTILRAESLQYVSLIDQAQIFFSTLPPINLILYNPYSLMLFAVVFLTSLSVITASTRIVKGVSRREMLYIPLYMMVYYSMIMVFWVVSVLHEIFKRGKTW